MRMGVQEGTVGEIGTREEEEGAVMVLKLSNAVMLRVPVTSCSRYSSKGDTGV
jgi:hypothetical protein